MIEIMSYFPVRQSILTGYAGQAGGTRSKVHDRKLNFKAVFCLFLQRLEELGTDFQNSVLSITQRRHRNPQRYSFACGF
jgi:hypothetical protein